MAIVADAAERRRRRVLVVDDDPGVREMLLYVLQSRGFHAEGAEDGVQALARLQHAEFQVIVTDYQMPRLDGLALLREVHRMDRPLPVVIHSSQTDPHIKAQLRRVGAFRILTKGGALTDLMQAIEEACRVSERSPARCA